MVLQYGDGGASLLRPRRRCGPQGVVVPFPEGPIKGRPAISASSRAESSPCTRLNASDEEGAVRQAPLPV